MDSSMNNNSTASSSSVQPAVAASARPFQYAIIAVTLLVLLLMIFALYKTFSALKNLTIITKLLVRAQKEKDHEHMQFIQTKRHFYNRRDAAAFIQLRGKINAGLIKYSLRSEIRYSCGQRIKYYLIRYNPMTYWFVKLADKPYV